MAVTHAPLSQETFEARAHHVHQRRYGYGSATYVNQRTKVTITCPVHGVFSQLPGAHLRGAGCRRCGLERMAVRQQLSTEEFVARAVQVHQGRYRYPHTKYASSKQPVQVECLTHGEFSITPNAHLSGLGCRRCAAQSKFLDQEEFLAKARAVHGERYDYSKVTYTDTKSLITIVCPEHGEFHQRSGAHLQGSGCPSCGAKSANKRSNLGRFVARARARHGERYDYTKAVYRDVHTRIEIGCARHGDFLQEPAAHLSGQGCPKCSREAVGAKNRLTTDEFIASAHKVHGSRYIYSGTQYISTHDLVRILCPLHGEFIQKPILHLAGRGCQLCGVEATAKAKQYSQEEYIAAVSAVHEGKYTYPSLVFRGIKNTVEVTCGQHGSFWQEANNHLQGQGCPSCSHQYSKPHKEVECFLRGSGVEFDSNSRNIIPPRELDIYVPSRKLAIEFNGTWWHSLDGTQTARGKNSHRDKYRECLAKGIRLLQINEDEWTNPVTRDIWKSILASRLGKHTFRIHARETSFRPISTQEAVCFLAENHLQGPTKVARWCFGLTHKDDLVAVMTFAAHEKEAINLTRLAFPTHVTVVGGATKLFANSLPFLPHRDIVTFSDNRYSHGDIYPVLGFTKDKDLPPSYQWYFRGELWNKRRLRHKYLPSVLGDAYRPEETEHQNMFRAGARCLYDAGYQRWMYPRISES